MPDLFTEDELHHLPSVLSAPRFSTYLRHCDMNRPQAMALYRWNLQVSAALMVPLHVLEISLRNAISEAIEYIHGGSWPWTQGFVVTLPNPRAPSFSPRRNLENTARNHPTVGKVVADLSFAFWEKMLTRRHQRTIWNSEIRKAFPHAPDHFTAEDLREQLRGDVQRIRMLRNRIAHHEPIIARDLPQDLNRIIRAIAWRNETAANWALRIETVSALITARP